MPLSHPSAPASTTLRPRPSKHTPSAPATASARAASTTAPAAKPAPGTTTADERLADKRLADERSAAVQKERSEERLAALQKENDALNAALQKERAHSATLNAALERERVRCTDLLERVRSAFVYARQVPRLVSVFRELDVNLPPLDSDQWDATAIARGVRAVLNDTARDADDAAVDYNTALECLRLLFGAAEISTSDVPNSFKFVLRNHVLQREMSFWLSWNETTFTYTRISMNIPERDAPEFWPESSIEFDIRQGPNFLLQVLGSLFHQQS